METRLPVSPAVHIQRSRGTTTAAWTSGPVERTVGALESMQSVEPSATVQCDLTGVTGRFTTDLARLNLDRDVRSLTVAPKQADWTVVWEAQQTPVVYLTGEFDPATCRDLHTGTTDCPRWSTEAEDRAAAAVE